MFKLEVLHHWRRVGAAVLILGVLFPAVAGSTERTLAEFVDIDCVIADLEAADPAVRSRAVKAVGILCRQDLVGRVLKHLWDPDENVRVTAAEAIEVIGTADTDSLLRGLSDWSPRVRGAVAAALARLHGPKVENALRKSLKDASAEVRSAAARSLGLCGTRESVSVLVDGLVDWDSGVRAACAEALGIIGDRSAIEPLAQVVTDGAPTVRAAAILALAELEATSQRALIESRLMDWEATVRLAAAHSLARLGSKESIPALRRTLNEPNAETRAAVVRALGRLGTTDPVSLFTPLAVDWAPEVREAVAEALGALPPQEGTRTMLVALSQDSSAPVRAAAVLSIGKCKLQGECSRVGRALSDWNADVRLAAAESLGLLSCRDGVEGLVIRLRRDSDARVRRQVVDALLLIGDPVVVADLEAARMDWNREVGMAAEAAARTLKGGGPRK